MGKRREALGDTQLHCSLFFLLPSTLLISLALSSCKSPERIPNPFMLPPSSISLLEIGGRRRRNQNHGILFLKDTYKSLPQILRKLCIYQSKQRLACKINQGHGGRRDKGSAVGTRSTQLHGSSTAPPPSTAHLF